jgi:hypothetical protein
MRILTEGMIFLHFGFKCSVLEPRVNLRQKYGYIHTELVYLYHIMHNIFQAPFHAFRGLH